MTKPLRPPKFWELPPLDQLTRPPEWEALCDGCGKCCLNKLEDEETGQVVFTRLACRLLDGGGTCQCSQYDIRLSLVPDCIVFTPENIETSSYFMPASCAYRLRYEGKPPLPDWHPLICGSPPARMHREGARSRAGPSPPNTKSQKKTGKTI